MSSRDVVEEARLRRAQMTLAKDVWLKNRNVNRARGGDGYLRWTDPDALRIVSNVTGQALDAGCEWVDIERAIVIVASDPLMSPRRIFDIALQEQATRLTNERRLAIEAQRTDKYEGPTLPRMGFGRKT